MKMNLKSPCAKCPFRTDCLKGWLGKDRAEQIANSLSIHQQSFACHETTKTDNEGNVVESDGEEHCAGAIILLERSGRANQWMRWMGRLGMYDHTKMKMESPVFKTFKDFVKHHTNRNRTGRKVAK